MKGERFDWTGLAIWIIAAAIIGIVLGGAGSVHTHETHGRLINAIHQVETSGRLGPIKGDNGRALGPLQIHRACWIDSGIPGTYEDCASLEYSKRVFRAYVARYATVARIGRAVTDEDRARIWNGGPNGYRKAATVKYWNKVQGELNNGR